MHLSRCLSLGVVVILLTPIHRVQAQAEKSERRPHEFAIIFNMGYAGDRLPRDEAAFEKLLVALKDASYNTILCTHTEARERLCKKHNLKMMVDLLAPEHHIYKNVEGAKALCTQLRSSGAVYAYHLWSDNIAGTAKGRNRDIANVHEWDPKHATYLGSYNARELDALTDPDLIGYYDFHWKRGGHFRHLSRTHEVAKKADCRFLCYIDGAPGLIGKGNYNRLLYTVATSMAFGLKGYTYHHTGQEVDQSTWTWKDLGKDLQRVNAEVAALGGEMMKLSNPIAVYSTPISKTAKNDPVDKPGVPDGLTALPEDAAFQVTAGEALIGVYPEEKSSAYFFANHNAYEVQAMKLRLRAAGATASRFDRAKRMWQPVPVSAGSIEFAIAPANGELVRIQPAR